MKQIDEEITRIMAVQGYQTTKYIALKIGVSERTVSRHLDDMIKQRMIKVVAVPNPVLCGFKAWAKIGIKIEPGCLETVARKLVEHPAVYFVAYSLGRYDIIIAVHFDTINTLTQFVSTELISIKGVNSSETLLLSSPRKYYNFNWPKPESNPNELSVSFEKSLPDELNRHILDMLMKDAHIPAEIISSKLGVSERIIHKRIKRMLSENILTIQVVLNPQILENQVWTTMGIVISKRSAHEVIDSILKIPQIYLASVSLGRFNIVIAGHFNDMDLLNRFVTHELASIEGIGSIETFVHNKPLKYHNVPLLNFQASDGGNKPGIEKKGESSKLARDDQYMLLTG
jgi:Lrp/AsnC family transcriptional regulator, regulator for asnA, asnC and gidA